jgi:S1-C subfamily serine protease
MDDLNAQQIVLLTLLVSFVTSIATGITTVSLLEQAPEPVTQTINRVVEKTVERVVTEPAENTETVIEKEIVTVVVNEEDLTIEAVENNSRSIVRIYKTNGDLRTLVSLGVIFNNNGDIITDSIQIQDREDYIGVYQSGEFPLSITRKESGEKFATLSIADSSENPNPQNFRAATFTDSNSLRLGQSVISLSGENKNAVSTGIINSLETNTEGVLSHLETSVDSSKVLIGSVILNLTGEIAGIKIQDQTGLTSFVPANDIKSFLASGDLVFNQQEISEDDPEISE